MIIDVSEHNGTINWDAVKTKIEAAIIRVGYGCNVHSQDDHMAAANISACEAKGIPYGIYLYSYADTMDKVYGEIEHMRRVLSRIEFLTGHGPECGVWYDLEEIKNRGIWREASILWQDAFGPDAGIYMSKAYADKYIPDGCRKWVAAWGSNTGAVPADRFRPGGAEIWQYTSKGTLPGITGYVDCNLRLADNPAADSTPANYYTVDDLIDGICRGDFGNGSERKDALYQYLQDKVNRRYRR